MALPSSRLHGFINCQFWLFDSFFVVVVYSDKTDVYIRALNSPPSGEQSEVRPEKSLY